MRKISLFLLIFGLIAIGCDSNDDGDDDPSDAERFVGTWSLNDVSDAEGDVNLEANFNSIAATFNADDTFSIAIDAVEGGTDLNLTGTWTLVEASETLTLNATVPGIGSIPLTFNYEFSGENILLTAGPQTTAALNGVLALDPPLVSPVVFTTTPL